MTYLLASGLVKLELGEKEEIGEDEEKVGDDVVMVVKTDAKEI